MRRIGWWRRRRRKRMKGESSAVVRNEAAINILWLKPIMTKLLTVHEAI